MQLDTREDVERFENRLLEYLTQRVGSGFGHLSLVDAFDVFQSREDRKRLFAAAFDMRLNYCLLALETHAIGVTWNQLFSKGKNEGGSVLDTATKFSGKMDIFRASSSFVLRYRALWDKFMGFLVLLYVPEQYDAYCSAKSKQRTFKKICDRSGRFPEHVATEITKIIGEFDDLFRTAEAHGTGALRKFSFTMDPMHENPQIEIIGYWNIANHFMSVLGDIIGDRASQLNAH